MFLKSSLVKSTAVRMYVKLALILLCFLPGHAWAIVNAEDTTLLADGEGLTGKFAVSAEGSHGNVITNGFESGTLLRLKHAKDTEILAANYKISQSRGVRNANKSYVHLRHRHALSETWAWEGFGQSQQDEFANLKLRALVGAGVRWGQQHDIWSLHLGAGTFYEYEKLRKSAVQDTSRLWRANMYMTTDYMLSEQAKLHETMYLQPAWQALGDIRILNDTSLHVALTKHLALRVTLEVSYDARPPVATVKTNVSYQTGIAYHF